MPVSAPDALGKLAPVLDLVDDRFGLVHNLVGVTLGGKEPPFWVFTSKLARPFGSYFVSYDCEAWGSSIDKNEALFKCLGEILERYCMYNAFAFDDLEVLPASACSFLEELPTCSPQEKAPHTYKKFDPNWQLTQVKVVEVANGEQHWLPVTFIHFAFEVPHGEPNVTVSHSSGTAFHETLHQAVWAGLCEVAERDAFSLFWLNQSPVPEIDIQDSNYAPLAARVETIMAAGLKLHCFDMTTDFNVPAVFAMIKSDEWPYVTVGASCGADPMKAICKAIDEIFLVRFAQTMGKDSAEVPSFTEFDWVSTIRDHSDLFAFWKDTPALDFFFNDKRKHISAEEFAARDWWTEPKSYEELQDRCSMLQKDLGMTVLYADLTLDDVSRFGYGVKVVVPQMQPISVPYSLQWKGTKRLREHAEKYALEKASNPYPHPFP